VLDARDALATRAGAQGLGVPEGLEAAYEGAASAAALALVRGRLLAADETLAGLADAQVAVDAPRDWLAGVGLGDEDPAAVLDAARSAWSAGDTTGAGIAAGQLVARVRSASDAGRTRVLAIALLPALAAAGLVIGGLVLAGRRRRAVRG
jgi:hypothetical protein